MDPSPPSDTKPKGRGRVRRAREPVPFYAAPPGVETAAQIVSEAKQELLAKQNVRDKVRGVKSTARPFTPRDDERSLFGQASSDYPNRPVSAVSIDEQFLEGLDSRPPSAARPLSGSLRPLSSHGSRATSASSRPHSGLSSRTPSAASTSARESPARPPSGVSSSIGSAASSLSRVSSGLKLSPLEDDSQPQSGVIPRPPSGDPRRKARIRAMQPQQLQSGVVEPVDPDLLTSRRGSLGDLTDSDSERKMVGDRRVHSGPKERTSSHMVEGESLRSARRRAAQMSLEERGEGDGQEVPSPTASKRQASSAEKVRHRNTEYAESVIQALLETVRESSAEQSLILATSEQIYEKLDSAHLLGKASSNRTSILKVVFRFIEKASPEVVLSLAKLALGLRVSGKYLTTVCKLIFKVSKDTSNDQLFITSNILDLLYDTMISIDSEQAGDALLFSCGVIKFLAGNVKLSETLSGKCTLYTLSSILSKINKIILDSSRVNEKLVQVLSQLTTALRRFAERDSFTSQFVSHSIIDELCVTSVACSSEYELMMNIASTLSKLTEHALCCECLSKHPSCYRSLLKLLRTYTHKEELVSRICFVLGNLADQDDESRLSLFREKNSTQTLMSVFEHYLELSLKDTSESRGSTSRQSTEVLTKLIRVIANLSVCEDVGMSLCDDKKCVQFLLRIIDLKDIVGHDELVLNSMTTINNLSFYSSTGTVIEESEVETSRCLMKLLLRDHKEGLSEACRIYGNLTRSRLVRDFLTSNSVLEMMVTLLDSTDQDLVYFCCGVLINFMLDEDKRPVLQRENGISKLLDVLHDFATLDWQLAGLVCQLLWNYSTKIRSSNLTFGEQESQQLISLLTDYIDNPHLPADEDGTSSEMRSYLYNSWRSEFCSVASQLRKRIKSHQSKFVELTAPADV